MRRTPRIVSALVTAATTAVFGLGVAVAPPASATSATTPGTLYLVAGTNASACPNSATVASTSQGAAITSLTATPGDSLAINVDRANNTCTTFEISFWSASNQFIDYITMGTQQSDTTSSGTVPAGAAAIDIRYYDGSNYVYITQHANPTIGFTLLPAPAPAGGDGAAPALVDLTVPEQDCVAATRSGYVGSWLTLASECAAPAGKPGAVLLGWATSPSFPVAIAQRQADHKWGTYEMVDADGTLAAVFTPATAEATVRPDA